MANIQFNNNHSFANFPPVATRPAPKVVALNYKTAANGYLSVKFEVNGKVTNYRKNAARTTAEQETFDKCVSVMHKLYGRYADDKFWHFYPTQEAEVTETYIDDDGLWAEEVTRVVKRKVPTLKCLVEEFGKLGYHVNLHDMGA